jgi:phytoene dehydrogenase-like protein
MPPLALVTALGHRGRKAPVASSFGEWAIKSWGPETAQLLSNFAGVFSFDADPARLSAAFVWERLLRVSTPKYPAVRYLQRGWGSLVDRLADRARALGVLIATSSPVDRLPEERPLIVATELAPARKLLGDDSLRWEGSDVALLDLGIESRRDDPFVVSDLDAPGWAECFSACDPTLAPQGHSLVQAQVGLREDESLEAGVSRAEQLLDVGYPNWRERERWRRRSVLRSRSGALDLPGTSWPDRHGIERGDGVFLAGDMVAAPGLLSEVSFNSAVTSARLAVADSALSSGVLIL